MRLLFFVQGEAVEDQIGYDDAFRTIQSEGGITAYKAVPWRGYALANKWGEFFNRAHECVDEFQPDVIYFQFFHEKNCPEVTDFFALLRKTSSRPTLVVSAGDAFSWMSWFGRRYPEGFLSAARSSDITFVSALGKCADYLVQKGVKNIVLLPLGVCQVRFNPKEIDTSQYNPEFDVIFIGSGGRLQSHPLSFSFYSGRKRARMVDVLQKRYGKKFGLFGGGWKGNSSWQGPVPYAEQVNVCRRSQVIFGGCPGIYQDYYASDRPFIQGVSGIPLVDWAVPRVDKLLRDQEHWCLVYDETSMIRQIDTLLEMDVGERLGRAEKTAHYIHENLSQESMMRFLVNTCSSFRRAKQEGAQVPFPEFKYFLPEVDQVQEQQYALRQWIG